MKMFEILRRLKNIKIEIDDIKRENEIFIERIKGIDFELGELIKEIKKKPDSKKFLELLAEFEKEF